MDRGKWILSQSFRFGRAVRIEIASLISKSHRTNALPTALGFNCCQMLPTKCMHVCLAISSFQIPVALPCQKYFIPLYTKRTLCSDSSVISVYGRQAPKEHRREGPPCSRSGSSLCFSSGASGLPSTVNYDVVHNFHPCQKSRHLSDYRSVYQAFGSNPLPSFTVF
jgi:hypothetical protein